MLRSELARRAQRGEAFVRACSSIDSIRSCSSVNSSLAICSIHTAMAVGQRYGGQPGRGRGRKQRAGARAGPRQPGGGGPGARPGAPAEPSAAPSAAPPAPRGPPPRRPRAPAGRPARIGGERKRGGEAWERAGSAERHKECGPLGRESCQNGREGTGRRFCTWWGVSCAGGSARSRASRSAATGRSIRPSASAGGRGRRDASAGQATSRGLCQKRETAQRSLLVSQRPQRWRRWARNARPCCSRGRTARVGSPARRCWAPAVPSFGRRCWAKKGRRCCSRWGCRLARRARCTCRRCQPARCGRSSRASEGCHQGVSWEVTVAVISGPGSASLYPRGEHSRTVCSAVSNLLLRISQVAVAVAVTTPWLRVGRGQFSKD